jgi:dTMP kinase
VAEVIRPALAQGQLVVCDRFMDSSLVYQGYARGLGQPVTVMNQLAVGDCLPDVTFLVLVDPKTGMNRIQHKDRDRLEQLDETFHQKVYEGYIQLWEQSPNRIHRINGTRDQKCVFEDVKDIIDPILAKR